jgi:hypothetical protein
MLNRKLNRVRTVKEDRINVTTNFDVSSEFEPGQTEKMRGLFWGGGLYFACQCYVTDFRMKFELTGILQRISVEHR